MDKPASLPWPPMIYLTAIVISVILGMFMPLGWISGVAGDAFFIVGVAMVIAGFALDLYAMRTLHKHNTTVMPTKGADFLVTSGPFAFSRNPIYLGNTIITIGLGIVFSNAWFFLMAIVAALITSRIQIVPEEKHLAARFGSQWMKYRKKTRRWL